MSACVDGMGVGAEGAGAALELDESPITESVPVLDDDDDDEVNDCAVLTGPVSEGESKEGEEVAAVIVADAATTGAGRAGEGEDVAEGAFDIFMSAEVGVDVNEAGRRMLVRGLG